MSEGSPARRTHSSGGAYEQRWGYARAVRTGERVLVSGCTGSVDGTVADPGDAAAQADRALRTALQAIEALGGGIGDVVRTRMYLVRRQDCESVGQVHRRWFAEIRPAATMVLVAGLVDEEMLVEIEVEARVGISRVTQRG